MILSHVIFYVKDVKASTVFYEKAFRLTTRFIHEKGVYAEMETGTTALAFASIEVARQGIDGGVLENHLLSKPQAAEIVLETQDVDEAFNHALSRGASPVTSPTDMPWGQRVSRVRDLDGILVELASPMHS
jgi:lactoylglutathione lyase